MSLDIAREGDAGRATVVSRENGQEPKTDNGRLVTARIDRYTYASISTREDGKDYWTLVRYELPDPNRLTIYLDNGKFWTDAVNNNVVSGRIEKSKSGMIANSTIVTASSDEMYKVVLGYGSVIFDDVPIACEFTRDPAP